MTRLFRAYTVRENYKGRDTVIVDWFCSKRETPAVEYENLVENYGELGEDERARAHKLIDHFLTESEIKELDRYMDGNFGFEVKSKPLNLPFKDGRKIPNFAAPPTPADEGDYFDLSSNQGYDLSVPISGFYDLSEPPNLISYMN